MAIPTQSAAASVPTPNQIAVPVTADNFIRVESDAVFTGLVAQGGVGKGFHNREVTAVDNHVVQRPNRDTQYSTGVFDLDAGPVMITLPDAGTRYLRMIVIDEDHYVFNVMYGAGRQAFSKDKVGTRYAVAAIRILVDPNDPKDVERVHALQDAVKVEQPGGPGKFELPNREPSKLEREGQAPLTTAGGRATAGGAPGSAPEQRRRSTSAAPVRRRTRTRTPRP